MGRLRDDQDTHLKEERQAAERKDDDQPTSKIHQVTRGRLQATGKLGRGVPGLQLPLLGHHVQEGAGRVAAKAAVGRAVGEVQHCVCERGAAMARGAEQHLARRVVCGEQGEAGALLEGVTRVLRQHDAVLRHGDRGQEQKRTDEGGDCAGGPGARNQRHRCGAHHGAGGRGRSEGGRQRQQRRQRRGQGQQVLRQVRPDAGRARHAKRARQRHLHGADREQHGGREDHRDPGKPDQLTSEVQKMIGSWKARPMDAGGWVDRVIDI